MYVATDPKSTAHRGEGPTPQKESAAFLDSLMQAVPWLGRRRVFGSGWKKKKKLKENMSREGQWTIMGLVTSSG